MGYEMTDLFLTFIQARFITGAVKNRAYSITETMF